MTFAIRFFISNIYISIFLGAFLLLKNAVKKYITPGSRYHLWYICSAALFVPFLPCATPIHSHLFLGMRELLGRTPSAAGAGYAAADGAQAFLHLDDFSMAVSAAHPLLHKILPCIWGTGILLGALFCLYSGIRIRILRKNARLITQSLEPELWQHYSGCLRELHIRRHVRLYASCSLKSPVSYGWLFPKVLIPQDLDICLTGEELRFVFLHELFHYRHGDALFNSIICLLQTLYWFNPLVWYSFRQLRKDREIACDHAVLGIIGKTQCTRYGCTLLKYASNLQSGMFLSTLSSIGGKKSAICHRIMEIAGYRPDTSFRKKISAGVLLLVLIITICASPLFAAYTPAAASFDFSSADWKALDLSSFFQDAQGSFVLYDMSENSYGIYNKEWSTLRLSPDSTYKIYSALFALEENLISPTASLQKWDKTAQPFKTWEQDHTLASAMQNSVNWYFQNLDREMGISALAAGYHEISYGNCDLSGGIDSYWAESSLKISPLEQVLLLRDLLQNKWGFQEEHIEAVKDAMFLADTPAGRLYGKTGTGSVRGRNVNGWFVGFIENQGKIRCFAANLHGSGTCTGAAAADITLKILGCSSR